MKSPLMIASLILPMLVLAACKPALNPPVAQREIPAVSDKNWKRNPAAVFSVSDAESPATGLSPERTDRLTAPERMPVQSAAAAKNTLLSDAPEAADPGRSQQNSSLQARRSLALQLLQALSAARP